MDVAEWLRGLGLEQYVPAFRDNDIDGQVLRRLTGEDLRELGVTSVGHRRRLLDAVAVLSDNQLAAELPPASSPAPHAAAESAQRRQLTVMFCDLVGSTALSARLDPEDLREVYAVYHRTVAEVVRGFDGFVANYMGDGVLAYFGYPQAHEDDAERAVRAGLGSIDAIGGLDVKSVELQARVGIATGLVIVGDLIGKGSAQEQSVVGETPNLAARLQALAEPDTVVIAAGTRRLIGGLFEVRDLGAVEVRGIAEPVPAWQVLRPSAVTSRFEALRGSALSPLVGRGEEIDLLLRRWARVKSGEGQVVLVTGEPGIGKSRLTAALEERLQTEPHIRLRYFCSPYHQDSALFPFIDQLGRASGFAPDDPPRARLEKLAAVLARSAQPDEDVALLADLLSLPSSERYPLPTLSPQRKKDRTLEALIRQLEGLAHQQPITMVFEDAHWIDPTSRELLDLTVERISELPVLLIVTFRHEFQPLRTGQPQVTMLGLSRLDRRDRTALITQIAGSKPLSDEIIDQIVERTDGVPLFVEELTRSVLESDAPLVGIPITLHDLLMARLDRVASMRAVAQAGAAIGREFSYQLLRAVCDLSEDELRSALGQLVASELVFQRGISPNAIYSFKHALVQDAAHSSLLRSSRQQLHARIAASLEAHSPELVDSQPELVAQHYAEAGLIERSVVLWSKAGQRSAARSAMAEAAAQFRRGLDQLALLPETPERQREELEIWSALGAVLVAVKGSPAPETGHAYARARELWEQLGSPSEFLQVPYGLARCHGHQGEIGLALCLDEDLLRLSRQRNDSAGLVLGHHSCGRDLLVAGSFASSKSHLEAALALFDPISHGLLPRQVGGHPALGSQAILGIVLVCLGYLDQALAQSSAAVAEARRLAHPPYLAPTLGYHARVLTLLREETLLSECVGQMDAVATEQGFPFWRAQATVYRGWVKANIGDVAEGISLLRDGASAYGATGGKWGISYYIALLAKACEVAGQIEEALALVNEALQTADNTEERWLVAEMNRHKGQLLARQFRRRRGTVS